MGIVGIPLLLMLNKYESLIYINQHHSYFLDVLMYHLTRIPELASIVFIIILGLFAERRQFFAIIVALSLCGLFILLSKNFIFSEFKRPFAWIMENPPYKFHFVDGIKLHSNGSFPSGHTISAFCSLGLIGFLSRNSWIQLLLFILALSMGYSRIYTLQHYLMDVYAGALAGYAFAFFISFYMQNKFITSYWQSPIIKLK